jgi:hypothetical protein
MQVASETEIENSITWDILFKNSYCTKSCTFILKRYGFRNGNRINGNYWLDVLRAPSLINFPETSGGLF